jgi:hypothetical protein
MIRSNLFPPIQYKLVAKNSGPESGSGQIGIILPDPDLDTNLYPFQLHLMNNYTFFQKI